MEIKLEHNLTYTSSYEKLSQQVAELVGKSPAFDFDITEPDISGELLQHPDLSSKLPLFSGQVRLQAEYWRINSTLVTSPILTDPTWQDILIATNNLLVENKAQGLFLESLWIVNRQENVLRIHLQFGS